MNHKNKIDLVRDLAYLRIQAYNDSLDELRVKCPKFLFDRTAEGVYECIKQWQQVIDIIEDKGE